MKTEFFGGTYQINFEDCKNCKFYVYGADMNSDLSLQKAQIK
jgi:hypothetical protein